MRDADDDEGTHTRAPARAAEPEEAPYEDPVDAAARAAQSIDDRIMVVAQLLTTGRWSASKALWLRQLWAVSAESIKDYATQANRLRRLAPGVKSLVARQRKIEAQLQASYELAYAKGDAKAATAASKVLADVWGLTSSKRVGDGQPAGLPPAQAALVQLFLVPGVLPFVATKQRLPTEDELKQLIETTGETSEDSKALSSALAPASEVG